MEATFSLTYTSRDLNTCKPGDHLAYMYLDAVGASKTRSHEYPTKKLYDYKFCKPKFINFNTAHIQWNLKCTYCRSQRRKCPNIQRFK